MIKESTMKRLVILCFVLLALFPAARLSAQLQLDWDLVILSVNGNYIQMRLDVVNNTDQAWSHTFGYSNIALYSIDGLFYPDMWLPVVIPYTLEPGQSDSFTMMHYYNLDPGIHLVQAHLNIPVGDSYLAVGEPETVIIGDLMPLTVGDGSEPARVPIDFYWRTSIYQCIFTAADLGNQPGIVSAISFYNAFSDDIYNNFLAQNIRLWLSVTPLNDLSGGWISASDQLTQFIGVMDFPAGHNEIRINLMSPINLNGTNNVLLTVFRPIHSSYQYTSDPFFADECPADRALLYYSDAWEVNPSQPPDLQGWHQFNRLPKTTFHVFPTGDPVLADDPHIPAVLLEVSACPNPFSHSCELRLSEKAFGMISIYDLRGRRLRQLSVKDSDKVQWDGKDQDGCICPNGIYLYRASLGNQRSTGKLIRLGG